MYHDSQGREIEDLEMDNMIADSKEAALLEQWQIDAILQILDLPVQELETNSRFYLSSDAYGDSRYHMINKRSDSIQIEQTEVDNKWGSRVNIPTDELPRLVKILLQWELENIKQKQDQDQAGDPDLGDLDDHPF